MAIKSATPTFGAGDIKAALTSVAAAGAALRNIGTAFATVSDGIEKARPRVAAFLEGMAMLSAAGRSISAGAATSSRKKSGSSSKQKRYH